MLEGDEKKNLDQHLFIKPNYQNYWNRLNREWWYLKAFA